MNHDFYDGAAHRLQTLEQQGIGYGPKNSDVCPFIDQRDGSQLDLRTVSEARLKGLLEVTNGTGWVALQTLYEYRRREALGLLESN
jgi:hypothetical protein